MKISFKGMSIFSSGAHFVQGAELLFFIESSSQQYISHVRTPPQEGERKEEWDRLTGPQQKPKFASSKLPISQL